ncbi:acyl-CoA synthetase [Kineococcus rhizosphaerae]|uniref:Fatty-acyl-CoA synthase n=1 Tax=Kineococcus rhizosphaerae TaxID=559628 RepID=A0A2T0R388_9ACTN|nr:long-chain fatty acid--CoA ligase [Kineococcus rhizosphaerae]PRY14463.1 fatty-acyl-CoA synthase [Kineococcus rhizosphaerae]
MTTPDLPADPPVPPSTDLSPDRGLGSWPWRRARIDPHVVALGQGTRTRTYAELADRTDRLAAGLRSLGVARGDRVAFLGLNDVDAFELLFACGRLGALFVPLNVRLVARELAFQLRDSGTEVLVVGAGVEAVAADLRAEDTPLRHTLALHPAAANPAGTLADLLDAAGPPSGDLGADLDDPAVLLYTSGTTGRPKAAVLTHGNLTWNTVNQLAHLDFTHDERALCTAPLFHAVGLGMVSLPTLLKGGRLEVLPRFDAGGLLEAVVAHRATSFSCVPTMLQMVADHPAWPAADLSTLRTVVYGGSPVTERVARAWRERGIDVVQGYGMTEAAPGVFMETPARGRTRPTTVGAPHFFTDVAAAGPDGAPVALTRASTPAELLVRGPNVFQGYWGRPADTAAATVDGWYRTGDVVDVSGDVTGDVTGDGEDRVRVVDRLKDLFISGGENVYPAEVEAVIAGLPGVATVALVPVPDERWGEVGAAYVTALDGHDLDPEELRERLRGRVAAYKIPRWVFRVDELPVGGSGKIRRADLRRQAAEDVARRVAAATGGVA